MHYTQGFNYNGTVKSKTVIVFFSTVFSQGSHEGKVFIKMERIARIIKTYKRAEKTCMHQDRTLTY